MANRSDRGGEAPKILLANPGPCLSIGSPPADSILARSRGLHKRAEDTTAVRPVATRSALEIDPEEMTM